MTRLLTAAYLLLFFAAAQPGPHAFTCAVIAPAVGFVALTRAACRLSEKGSQHD